MRKVFAFALTVVWILGVVLAYLIGENVGARKHAEAVKKARRRQARQHRGGMGPGDRDPRGSR